MLVRHRRIAARQCPRRRRRLQEVSLQSRWGTGPCTAGCHGLGLSPPQVKEGEQEQQEVEEQVQVQEEEEEGQEKEEQGVREEAEEEEWVARVVRREAREDQEQAWDLLPVAWKKVVVVVEKEEALKRGGEDGREGQCECARATER